MGFLFVVRFADILDRKLVAKKQSLEKFQAEIKWPYVWQGIHEAASRDRSSFKVGFL